METKISEKSWIPLGAAFSVATMISGGAWWCSNIYSRVSNAEERITQAANAQEKAVDQMALMNETLIEIRTELRIRNKRRARDSK